MYTAPLGRAHGGGEGNTMARRAVLAAVLLLLLPAPAAPLARPANGGATPAGASSRTLPPAEQRELSEIAARTLKKGMIGHAVKPLQNWLNRFGAALPTTGR